MIRRRSRRAEQSLSSQNFEADNTENKRAGGAKVAVESARGWNAWYQNIYVAVRFRSRVITQNAVVRQHFWETRQAR